MRALSDIVSDFDAVVKACIKEYGIPADVIVTLVALTTELRRYAESHEDDLK